MGFIRKAFLVGALVGATVCAAYKYHGVLEQEVAPRINYAVEKAGEIKGVFKPTFVKEQTVNAVQGSYQSKTAQESYHAEKRNE